jgi:hypothetical protein
MVTPTKLKSGITHSTADKSAVYFNMDWTRFALIDPHLLLGLVNTELRNNCESLDDFCQTHAIERAALCLHLSRADYHYQSQQKQFR